MKREDATRFRPSGFFAFRTPLLPFIEFLKWSEGLSAPGTQGDLTQLAQALEHDRALLRERLKSIVARPEVCDAIYVAAPNVIERLHLWTDEPDSKRGQKIEQVLVRYFTRMTGRATPFGLFAGCSVGRIGEATNLCIKGRADYERRTRLDAYYLYALADALAREPARRDLFSFQPNSSIYRAAGRVRYVETRFKDKGRSYHLVAVEDTDYLAATLARASAGACASVLAAALVAEDISPAEADEYIAELVASQLLVPDIALPVTGSEPLPPFIEQLREHAETATIAETLERTRAELAEIDGAGVGVEPKRYRAVARRLESLPVPVEPARLMQVDMFKPAPEATLGGAVLSEIIRGAEILHRLTPRAGRDELARFREAFSARYEERELPLLEALDEEMGVGFGASSETSPLLKDLVFPPAPGQESVQADGRRSLLLGKLEESLRTGAQEITLAQADLEALGFKEQPPLPDAFMVLCKLSAASPEALAQGEFLVSIQGLMGPSGAVMLGRFCHGDETLRQHVERHLRAEEALRPDAIFAEIVHLPEGRASNFLCRPVLRAYEIPYLGRSGAALDWQIPVADLYISVRGERVRLRSARLNCEIVPRLTTAHNYSLSGLGVYRFLCALQYQEVVRDAGWNWGALAAAPFLPRVKTGRLILQPARWLVSKDELRALGADKGAQRFRAVQRWRAKRRLPRLSALADYDNVLPVDLDNALSVDSFVELVREREQALLTELYPAPDQLCARGPEGPFVHELIIPFEKRDEKEMVNEEQFRVPHSALSVSSSAHSPQPTALRTFPPGSEWLYAKLYTGTATADRVLCEVVSPLVAELNETDATDLWFFLRYSEPDWHLRLRFHGARDKLYELVQPALQRAIAPLLDDGRIWRVQFDTYVREVERYGGAHGIELAERLFQIDSEAALEILEMLEPGDAGADERWRLALYGMNLLLDDLGFDLPAKCALLKRTRDTFAKEFRADKGLFAQLRDKLRKERRGLEELLSTQPGAEHPLSPGLDVLHQRSERLMPVVEELKTRARAGRLTNTLPELAQSYLHMHANRLLRSAHREQELVLYDLLTRLYESQLARAK